ncbi:MAG: Spy/CpxP family protein refolding chaperone [Candidatus Sabulitectum sp.]|nr:Spy/CpxP family protein refolding chaperone [Candidatus Sabulitectum sp.]
MKRKTTVIATAAAILLLTGAAIAQPGGMPGRGMEHQRPGGQAGGDFFQRMLPMMRMLDLTDDQREAIMDIMEETRNSMESLRGAEEAGDQREDFLELFSSPTITTSQVESLLNGRLDKMEEANVIIARALVDIHDLLTAEQLATLAEFEPGSMEMRSSEHGGMGVHPHR